jgi:hypothetical protein
LFELANDSINSDAINISGSHNIKPASNVIAKVALLSNQWSSNACVYGRISDQSFFMGDVQESAMIDTPICVSWTDSMS